MRKIVNRWQMDAGTKYPITRDCGSINLRLRISTQDSPSPVLVWRWQFCRCKPSNVVDATKRNDGMWKVFRGKKRTNL